MSSESFSKQTADDNNIATMTSVNRDLQREREKCTFNRQELTHLIDGSPEKTKIRREREEYFLNDPELGDKIPPSFRSHKEVYEDAVRKGCILLQKIQQLQEQGKGELDMYSQILGGSLGSAILKDGNPLTLHYVMFIPTIMGQGTIEQQGYWMARAWSCDIIGTYAQTELGHGTFIRGLETTATYDPDTREFILNSPTRTSYKWWPGGLGNTANYAIVVAQLYTQGQCKGIHPFIVQLRDEETHEPLPGIKIGEIGTKLGMNGTNNGFLGLDHVRIPRENMLMKNSEVLEDGTYIRPATHKLTYGTMMFVRVLLVKDVSRYLSKAATIATRYSAVRRQSQINPDQPECQIMDFVTQQYKIFPHLAACFSFLLAADWIWEMYLNVSAELHQGELERLPEASTLTKNLGRTDSFSWESPVRMSLSIIALISLTCSDKIAGREKSILSNASPVLPGLLVNKDVSRHRLHALSCCLKAVASSDGAAGVEQLRLSCGGHGYMNASNLPATYGLVTAICTYEGENTVLLLQTARYLVKACKQALGGQSLTPTVKYLEVFRRGDKRRAWKNTLTCIVTAHQAVAAGKIYQATENIDRRVKMGMTTEEASNQTSIELAQSAEAHCRAFLVQRFVEWVKNLTKISKELHDVLNQLCELYAVYWVLQKTGDFLRYSCLRAEDIPALQHRLEDLLAAIRPNAVGLVDSFDIRDEILSSALGAYDGNVYERLFAEAMKSPLNHESVNQSFHLYLKPLLKSNL